MSDEGKIVSLSGSRAKKLALQPQKQVIDSLRELLALAESGEIQSFACIWSNNHCGESVYQVDYGDKIYTIGQLHQLAYELAALEAEF